MRATALCLCVFPLWLRRCRRPLLLLRSARTSSASSQASHSSPPRSHPRFHGHALFPQIPAVALLPAALRPTPLLSSPLLFSIFILRLLFRLLPTTPSSPSVPCRVWLLDLPSSCPLCPRRACCASSCPTLSRPQRPADLAPATARDRRHPALRRHCCCRHLRRVCCLVNTRHRTADCAASRARKHGRLRRRRRSSGIR